ncbi:MAG: hypothetical protein JO283_10005 [Bradyrhizobium sp.]|jgi:hypothetical protein|nr:hypothetical protein [Bradyrhizobium sp.]
MHLRQNPLLLTEPPRIEDNHPSQRDQIGFSRNQTKIVSAYSKAVISPTATMET